MELMQRFRVYTYIRCKAITDLVIDNDELNVK